MQRIARSLGTFRKVAALAPVQRSAIRSFSVGDADKLTIKTNLEQMSGIRWQELEAKNRGQVPFNEQPVIPDGDAGTFDNPIMVPSQHEFRFVGYEDPNCHQVRWFELQYGHLHYLPDIGLYFMLQYTPDTLPENKMVRDIEHSIAH